VFVATTHRTLGLLAHIGTKVWCICSCTSLSVLHCAVWIVQIWKHSMC